jgi:lysozyme
MKRSSIAALALSASALVGMAIHESYRGEAYHATADEKARGISTIGFGTTKGVKPGEKTTPERALMRLLADANEFERGMRKCIHVPLHQYEWDAYVSLTYNIGLGKSGVSDGFCEVRRGGPSMLVRKLNAQDYTGACREILRWNKQSGRVLNGLVKRREDEYRMCMGEVK